MIEERPIPPFPPWLRKYVDSIEPGLYRDDYQWQLVIPGQEEPHWTSNHGPQTWVILCPYEEVLIGGRRGGSKSAALIGWSTAGDLRLEPDDPARISYLNDPYFRGLFLRKEYQAMDEFIDECMDMYRPFGVQKKGNPVEFHFKSGAVWYTNHLQDKEAFEKYRGQGLTKIGIEELTQIEKEDSYLKLLGSLRGKKQVRIVNGTRRPPLNVQIMSTTNPDGTGSSWVKKRFVKMTSKGQLVPWNTPVRNPYSGLTRIFIPMKREDNPYLRNNKSYEAMLLEQSPLIQKQWIDGDWDASAGKYFEMFRPMGPMNPEEEAKTPWARHVIEPVPLRHYWYRFGGGDWGYSHKAVWHKGCRNDQDGRIHIYDELVLRQTGSKEMGMLLAKWWLPDLERLPDKAVTVALSPDAFNKTDATKTRAEQIVEGIKEVLGPYGAFLMRYTDDEREEMKRDPDKALEMFQKRRGQTVPKGVLSINIQMAVNNRVDGWNYIVDLLRFQPVLQETEEELEKRLVEMFTKRGAEAYEREVAKVRVRRGPEILPKLVLWKNCTEAIRFLSEAVHDEEPKHEDVRKSHAIDGVGGDDGGDSLRYTLMSYKEVAAKMPRSYWLNEQMDRAQAEHERDFGEKITDQTRIVQIAMTKAAQFDKANSTGGSRFNLPRAGSRRHWGQ